MSGYTYYVSLLCAPCHLDKSVQTNCTSCLFVYYFALVLQLNIMFINIVFTVACSYYDHTINLNVLLTVRHGISV
jgi:hypothetical protein